MSVLKADQQKQSPLRIQSRENGRGDGYRFRFRLYCLLIFTTVQEHAALTALCLLLGSLLGHHQDIPLALLIISLPGSII